MYPEISVKYMQIYMYKQKQNNTKHFPLCLDIPTLIKQSHFNIDSVPHISLYREYPLFLELDNQTTVSYMLYYLSYYRRFSC